MFEKEKSTSLSALYWNRMEKYLLAEVDNRTIFIEMGWKISEVRKLLLCIWAIHFGGTNEIKSLIPKTLGNFCYMK